MIQGAPGIGKSTLLSRITLSLASQELGELDARLALTPMLVPLLVLIREYADYLKNLPSLEAGRKKERSLLAFLVYDVEQKLRKKGVTVARNIAAQVEHWLRACRCLVMFDGLDEVSEKTLLQEIQQEIHDFIEQQRHPDVQEQIYNRFLITSRVAEYDAPALEGYRYFLVAELSLKQIKDFLPRWYHASIISSTADVKARAEQLTADLVSAIEKNEAVRKLAENPLLLTLMAIMLHNGTQLPERRVELYQAVAKTLLESRNGIKGLPKLYEDEAIQRLGPLAFAMQGKRNSLARRSEVESAIEEAIKSPLGSGARSAEEVKAEVSAYVESIGRRGGLFVLRTGDYYGFIHRSFQEYFAARHMLREIERDRAQKIKAFVKLVRDHPNTWREPFILAVASKSAGDSGPVASEMIRTLLQSRRSKGKNILHDVLLAAICVIEANYVNLDVTLQRDIAERLLSHYEQAQREQRFEDCTAIEEVVRDWLLVLREGESYLELPHILQSAICDRQHSKRQRSTLTLLAMIAEQLLPARYDIHKLLIPSLLALAGLDAIGEYQPATQLPMSTDFDVADLALTTLSFMGKRGPAGLLLRELRQYFKNNPLHLHNLARYSLECGTLITPTIVPLGAENYEQYKVAIGQWVQLRDDYEQAHITEQNITTCLVIHQALLDCTEEVSYPMSLHLPTMLQRATDHLEQWRSAWQMYLLEELDRGRYISYQEVAIFWVMLFPERRELQPLVDHIIVHYDDAYTPQNRHIQRFLSSLSRYLRYLRDLGDSSGLGGLRDLRDSRYLIDLRHVIDIRGLRSLRSLIYLRDLRDLRDLMDLIDLIDWKTLAEKACSSLPSHDNSQDIDILQILMGRILQVQEKNLTGEGAEVEVQRLATVPLGYLASGNMDAEACEAALDMVRSLPARTTNEIRFVRQVVDNITDSRVHVACKEALRFANPRDGEAHRELKRLKRDKGW